MKNDHEVSSQFKRNVGLTVAGALAVIALLFLTGCDTMREWGKQVQVVGVTSELKPVDFGSLLDPCEEFVTITEADNSTEVAFRNWYFRNLERASACQGKHGETVRLLKKHGLAK